MTMSFFSIAREYNKDSSCLLYFIYTRQQGFALHIMYL